jgi:hypothetical protein
VRYRLPMVVSIHQLACNVIIRAWVATVDVVAGTVARNFRMRGPEATEADSCVLSVYRSISIANANVIIRAWTYDRLTDDLCVIMTRHQRDGVRYFLGFRFL